ncbi:MAG: RIP metalloprotease RseP [Candidatus Magasanikbacteria bacterium]|jgi:regulator of sigma E protease|nr:RIP metalloprotease RseP [Candidatus Magasanikbacteria bacterium]MBT4314544.1 RIP metalloprotease RseP [Candidatus Magasanikbacteria bacterium]MBT4547442.1 RIP metalloprotease RseP [Candidatus Magasanikbacteria bacterium]MBT6819151.1 RIP metalloprotease RseP [Candidatus Magasanikbacteria bacterium]
MATVIIFILILSLLVLVHEWGHFITATKFGMKVHEFGIGFPPRAFGIYKDPKTGKWVWTRGKGKSDLQKTVSGNENTEDMDYPSTLYSFNWLPLGGFVRIKGENGEEANESDSFGHHKAWKRIVVLAAGVFMNIVLAGVVLGIGFMIGLPSDTSMGLDKGAVLVDSSKVLVQMVDKNSPAEEAGIQYGDHVLSVAGVEVTKVDDLINYLTNSAVEGEESEIKIRRNGEELNLSIKPELIGDVAEYPRFGFSPADVGIVRYPWYMAIYKGFAAAIFGLINIFIIFYLLIKNLILGQGLVMEVSGPVGIAKMVGDSAKLGFNYLLNVTAMISLSLAAINILPIPALDGGRILFVIIEKIIRRPVPMKYEQIAHTIGFVLLMVLIVVVTGRDILNLIR